MALATISHPLRLPPAFRAARRPQAPLPATARPPIPRRLPSACDFSTGSTSSAPASFPTQAPAPASAPNPNPSAPMLSSLPSAPHATPKRSPRPENVPGEFFVDHTCIDCDTCRWMAPGVFSRQGDMSAVHQQPQSLEERLLALQALLACPTSSIHTRSPPRDIRAVQETFPLPISPEIPGVYHCGYHSVKSFGAASYLVTAVPGLNVLVDSPRYTPALVAQLEARGGVHAMFLTHRDDVADHDKWAAHFRCPRIMHSADVERATASVEVQLQGQGPWKFPVPPPSPGEGAPGDHGTRDAAALSIYHVPGHTRGCICLLLTYPEASGAPGVLFTGDHLGKAGNTGKLSIHPKFNWFSVEEQQLSVCNLQDLPFRWILPGHGRRHRFSSDEERRETLAAFCPT